ncbi:MAG: hypothetical protein ACC726_08380 [Chloroflexota bacterium]
MRPQLDEAISDAVTGVTKKWAKQRKAEERHAAAAVRRRHIFTSARTTLKEAAAEIMEEAYLKVSADGRLPANARQIMYVARPHIQEATGQELRDSYFTQTLLPDYVETHGRDDWNVVFDARGHLSEPHTDKKVALGTLAVRDYLTAIERHEAAEPRIPSLSLAYPTRGPTDRFGAILFIEKEGFDELLAAAHIAERYDIAIMSTKGMSVTAGRELVDRLGVPLLVLHDFDQAGFSILGTLHRSTRRYRFRNKVEVIDAGLRLEDIETLGLEAEYQKCTQDYGTLRRNGATPADIAFLERDRRVELNALASDQLVALIEQRLEEQGIGKVVPDAERLEGAYRRAYQVALLNRAIADASEDASRRARDAVLPDALIDEVEGRLQGDPASPWDDVVAYMVYEALGDSA